MSTDKTGQQTANRRYATLWRWHFYAGLFVVPFMTVLALTGLAMLLLANTSGRENERVAIVPQAQVLQISQQAQSALDAVGKGAQLVQYIAPRAADEPAVFRVRAGEGAQMVVVNPYDGSIISNQPRGSGWYAVMDELHGSLMLDGVGDYLLETAAALSVILLATGIYMSWLREKSLRRMFVPVWGKGRNAWRSWHSASGNWVSVMLLAFLVSGMAWAGVWGEQVVQSWGQFPAGKWGVEPLPQSTVLHGSMNDGVKEVPWALEQTPMPQSVQPKHKPAGQRLVAQMDRIDALARSMGFVGRYQMNLPKGKTGVWTLSQDSMSYDSNSPTADRTVHIDRYSGKVLADIRFADYNLFGQFMAAGIALHMGTMGVWSIALNVVFCLAVVFICVSGTVMWLKRRPVQRKSLLAPKAEPQPWRGILWLVLPLALLFPTAIIAIAAVVLLDWLLVSRIGWLARRLR